LCRNGFREGFEMIIQTAAALGVVAAGTAGYYELRSSSPTNAPKPAIVAVVDSPSANIPDTELPLADRATPPAPDVHPAAKEVVIRKKADNAGNAQSLPRKNPERWVPTHPPKVIYYTSSDANNPPVVVQPAPQPQIVAAAPLISLSLVSSCGLFGCPVWWYPIHERNVVSYSYNARQASITNQQIIQRGSDMDRQNSWHGNVSGGDNRWDGHNQGGGNWANGNTNEGNGRWTNTGSETGMRTNPGEGSGGRSPGQGYGGGNPGQGYGGGNPGQGFGGGGRQGGGNLLTSGNAFESPNPPGGNALPSHPTYGATGAPGSGGVGYESGPTTGPGGFGSGVNGYDPAQRNNQAAINANNRAAYAAARPGFGGGFRMGGMGGGFRMGGGARPR
jgi:hypothetical protein